MGMFTFARPNPGANAPKHPEYDGIPWTASDSVDVPTGSGNTRDCRAIYVTGAGNVALNLAGGGTATLTGLTANTIYTVVPSRVLATGTTATGIWLLY